MSNRNANEAMIIFNQKITIAYNKSFPFVKLSRKRSNDKSWITTGLKQSIRQKHVLYQKYIYNSTEENNQIYKIFKKNSERSSETQRQTTTKNRLTTKHKA